MQSKKKQTKSKGIIAASDIPQEQLDNGSGTSSTAPAPINENDTKVTKKKNKNKKAKEESGDGDNKEKTTKELAKIEKKKQKKLQKKLKKLQILMGELKEGLGKKRKNSKNEEEPAESSLKTEKQKAAETGSSEKTQAKKLAKAKKKENKKAQKKEIAEKKEYSPKDPAVNDATVFVGNLPINTKRVQLIRLFKPYGPVNSIRLRSAAGKIIFKHKARKEAGSLNAYVVLKDAEAATKALALNGTEFKNNHLRVTPSNNQTNTDAKRMIFIGNLKYSATDEKLREIFSSCGEIEYIRCLHDGDKGCNKGVAYVCFKSPEAVGLAMELNETILDERPIHVERYSTNKLGAKKSRDAAASTAKKPQTGAKLRLNKKQKEKAGGAKKSEPSVDASKQKKSDFHGVKMTGIKKKKPKKNGTTQMQKLAKKIAPKV